MNKKVKEKARIKVPNFYGVSEAELSIPYFEMRNIAKNVYVDKKSKTLKFKSPKPSKECNHKWVADIHNHKGKLEKTICNDCGKELKPSKVEKILKKLGATGKYLPNKPSVEGWEDKFSKICFHDNMCNWPQYKELSKMTNKEHLKHCPYEELKSFISSLLSSEKAKAFYKGIDFTDRNYEKHIIPAQKAKWKKEVKRLRKDEFELVKAGNTNREDFIRIRSYNEAVEDFLKVIKTL